MSTWILHCHLGRRRVELSDPPTREAIIDAFDRVAGRPNWVKEIVVTALPTWEDPMTLRCESARREPIAVFKRSQARTPATKISIYLPPAVRERLLAAADAQGVTVSTLGGRLIAAGLAEADNG